MLEGASIDELVSKLENRLWSQERQAYIAHEAARAFVEDCAVAQPRSGTFGAMVANYAIRSDEVKLFDAMSTALLAAAGAGFFVVPDTMAGSKLIAGGLGVFVAAIKFFKNLWVRGVRLDDDQVRLLTILRCNNSGGSGMTEKQILEVIQRNDPKHDLAWVERHLKELSEYPTPDKGITKLVSKDSQGRWRPHV